MVLSMDLMPTFLSVAEIPLPEGINLDGIDVSPGILFEEPDPERPLFWRYGNKKSVIYNAWKLLIQDNPQITIWAVPRATGNEHKYIHWPYRHP